jgi:hypothetical protein
VMTDVVDDLRVRHVLTSPTSAKLEIEAMTPTAPKPDNTSERQPPR